MLAFPQPATRSADPYTPIMSSSDSPEGPFAFLQLALDATPDLVIIVDAAGKPMAMNGPARRVSEEGASEYPWNIQIIDDGEPTRERFPLRRALSERTTVHSSLVTMVHGEPALWDVRAAPIIER